MMNISRDGDTDTDKCLVTLNLSENKLYVFTPRGLMKGRIDYSRTVEERGPPKAVSNNGTLFLFKKAGESVLNVMQLGTEGFTFVK